MSANDGNETKTCPFCAEEVKSAAIKCKHCGSNLEAPTSEKSDIRTGTDSGVEQEGNSSKVDKQNQKGNVGHSRAKIWVMGGAVLVVVGIVAILLAYRQSQPNRLLRACSQYQETNKRCGFTTLGESCEELYENSWKNRQQDCKEAMIDLFSCSHNAIAESCDESELGACGGHLKRMKRRCANQDSQAESEYFEDFADLQDNPQRFKGRRLRIKASVNTNVGESIRTYVGKRSPAPFQASRFDENFNSISVSFNVRIPAGMEVPDADYSDAVIVMFDCNEGNLRRGNVAVSIDRQ